MSAHGSTRLRGCRLAFLDARFEAVRSSLDALRSAGALVVHCSSWLKLAELLDADLALDLVVVGREPQLPPVSSGGNSDRVKALASARRRHIEVMHVPGLLALPNDDDQGHAIGDALKPEHEILTSENLATTVALIWARMPH